MVEVKRCVDCGAVNNNGLPRCPQCYGKLKDAERLKGKNAYSIARTVSGGVVDSKPSDSAVGEALGFEGEAALLEKAFEAVFPLGLKAAKRAKENGFLVSGDGLLEFVHASASTVFIERNKSKRVKEMRGGVLSGRER